MAFLPPEARRGVVPRLLNEILTTRIMVKGAMKGLSPADKVLQRIMNARWARLGSGGGCRAVFLSTWSSPPGHSYKSHVVAAGCCNTSWVPARMLLDVMMCA